MAQPFVIKAPYRPSTLPVAVIGAGASGLSAALELCCRGHEVHLYEAHSIPGGCASWFRRSSKVGALQFDAGATVLDGLSPGSWLSKSLERWGVETATFERMPSIFYKLGRDEAAFEVSTKNADEWIRDLVDAFPEDRLFIENDLRQLMILASSLKELVEKSPNFPIQSLGDLIRNLRLLPNAPSLILNLVACGDFDFGSWLASRPHSERLSTWMQMNLLITVQCSPSEIYTPWAALALSFYPLGAGTLPSGMRGLMEPALRKLMADPRAKVTLRRKVIRIENIGNEFWLLTQNSDLSERREGPFRSVISSLSRFDTARIAPEGSFPLRDAWNHHEAQLWGACAAYVATRDDPSWPDTAFNVHSKLESGPGPEGNDAYLSFSKRNDTTRAPEGYRVLTISTHTGLAAWRKSELESYRSRKEAMGNKLLEHLRSWSKRRDFEHVEFATPTTFERYTHRRQGHVGGLPMTRENTLLATPSQRSFIRGLYQIGDTSFPGQSVYACALGGVSIVEKIETQS